ncbi:putative Chaperone HSP82 [Spironucleus salmonicida]|uniref:Chaperone HSP82 n=1 Tax=Spironucleus salmonicida TaxID=348837 RepID=V6LAW7_9EUKA|nr:putative Chaperone HSP82 [Spironucleus salmonicida]|eukprot:EST41557.1 Putative Wos2 protein [Spironucleus salmonicida]
MVHPTIFWAQNKDVVYLRIQVSSAANVDIKMEETSFSFTCNADKQDYSCKFNLFKEVDPSACKFKNLAQSIEVLLTKKTVEKEFWPTLNNGGKLPYVRVDFDRWIDEDEEEKPKTAMPDMGNFGGMDFSNFDPSQFKMPEGEKGAEDDEGQGEEQQQE